MSGAGGKTSERKSDDRRSDADESGDKKSVGKKSVNKKSVGKKKQIVGLILALILVVGGGVLFVGMTAGWFSSPVVRVDAEYFCSSDCDFDDLSIDEYEQMVKDKKSFVVFVDQNGCKTADNLEGFVKDYAGAHGFKVFRLMFEEMKKTSMHESVKYYPSVVLVSGGKVTYWLRGDSDEDAPMYNDYDEFKKWMDGKMTNS